MTGRPGRGRACTSAVRVRVEVMHENTASVGANYNHLDKLVLPGEMVEVGCARLKWYGIAAADAGIPDEAERSARVLLSSLDDDATASFGEAGFVIMHRCGPEFYFLLVQTWRNNNELWESIYARRSDAVPEFHTYSFDGPHRGTFCVWELAAVLHEKDAWRRYLRSARSASDLAAYLSDHYSGPC